MPKLRARSLEIIHNAYPETFGRSDPSKAVGEDVFDGPKPHPNTVLNFFIQQTITSALPIAYYRAARRGLDSLINTRFPSSVALSGKISGSAIRGLMVLREIELKEMHRIIFTIKNAANGVGCSSVDCPSRNSRGLLDEEFIRAHQRTFDRVTGSAVGGTRILQVLSAKEFMEDAESKFCQICADKMAVAHAEVRKKAWAALPRVFGLKA